MSASSCLSRAPTISSIAVTCEIVQSPGKRIGPLNRLRHFSGNVDEHVTINQTSHPSRSTGMARHYQSDKPSQSIEDAGGTQPRRSPLSLLTYSRRSAISALSLHIPAKANSRTGRRPAPGRRWGGEAHLDDCPLPILDILERLS